MRFQVERRLETQQWMVLTMPLLSVLMALLLGAALIYATRQPGTLVGLQSIGDFGKLSIVKLLIEAGADIDVKDTLGRTALMHASGAVESEHHQSTLRTPHMARLLIELGADVNLKDNEGRTALMFASNYEIESILEAAGAKE